MQLQHESFRPPDTGGYRPDVDGLRAVAVLAVIIYHANPGLLPGGFAGVDVFFVISGYLISGVISKELARGAFTFRRFYARRIRRILPALAVVSLFSSLASLYLLNVNDLTYFTTSLAACWLFSSNIFFSLLSSGYFDPRLELFPLLHTWSLGVEEQFYFAFPILLLALCRYQKKYARTIAVAATFLFIWLSERHSGNPSAYYLLQYRAHELLIGYLVVLAVRDTPPVSETAANFVFAIGLSVIISSFFLLGPHSRFPGLNSVIPCGGTALVIFSGASASGIRPLLANKPVVFVGLISYSLYLWHWPLLALLRYRGIPFSLSVVLGVIVLTFLLSYLTWRYVEVPSRSQVFGFRNAATLFYGVPALIFVSLAVLTYETGGLPQRMGVELRELMSSYSRETDLSRDCSESATSLENVTLLSIVAKCSFGDLSQGTTKILLMGDSHANHMRPFIDVLAKAAGLKAAYHVMGNCAPLLLDPARGDPAAVLACRHHNESLLALAKDFRFVVLGGDWSEVKGDMQSGLEHSIAEIVQGGAIPVIIRDTPQYDTDRSQCPLRKARGWESSSTNCNIPVGAVNSLQFQANRAIDAVRLKYPQMIVIDPKIVMCGPTECAARIANLAVFKDSNHINEKAARAFASAFLNISANPFNEVQ